MSETEPNPAPGSGSDDDEEKKGGVYGFFKRIYDWYDKIDTWKERIEWLLSFFKANAMATTVTATASAVAVTGAVVAANPDLRPNWFSRGSGGQPEVTAAAPKIETPKPATPVKVETRRWGSSVIFPIEGKDVRGRRAAFDVAVLPKDLAWVRKSDTQLAKGAGTIPETETVARIFTPELRAGLGESREVIAVGLASQEGRREEETARAANRARTAAGWLAKAMAPSTGIWTLNLGQFQAGCKATAEAADTGWQRPVMIVGIREAAEGVTLAEAFADAISDKSNLPSRECYSSFELARFR